MVVNDKGEPQRMTDDATDNHRSATVYYLLQL